MKIRKMREDYEFFTGKLSEIVRQLNFAGIAVIWIFRVGTEAGGIQYSPLLKRSLELFVLSLSFDLIQYVYQSIVWGSLNTCYFRKHQNEEKDVEVSGAWNYIALIFFWSKAAFATIAYIFLFCSIYGQF
jgi:hypothetical protein